MSQTAHLCRENYCVEEKSSLLEQLGRLSLICSVLSISQTVAMVGGRRVPWVVCRWEGLRQCLRSCMPRGVISAI